MEERKKPEGETRSPRPLPGTAWEFLAEVNQEAQFVEVVAGVLKQDKDIRVKQQLCKQLIDLAYVRKARIAPEEEERPPKISVNVPR